MVRFIKSHNKFSYFVGDLAELSEEAEAELISSGYAVAATAEEEAEEPAAPAEEPVAPAEEVPPVAPAEEVKEPVKTKK